MSGETNAKVCPFCGRSLILVMTQQRRQPPSVNELEEQLWHCPGCGFVAKFAVPLEKGIGPFKLTTAERLKLLGYI